MTHGASLPSFSFLIFLLITSKKLVSHQYMLLTWLLPRSPFALSSADPGPRLRPHRGLWSVDRNGGSSIMLASDSGGGPRSRWQLLVDPDGGSGQWLWTIVASDRDGGSWSCWLLTMDYDYNKTAWYTIFLLRYSTITDNNPSINLPSIMLQSVYSNQCCKYPYLSDVLLYTWHLLQFCPSWGVLIYYAFS